MVIVVINLSIGIYSYGMKRYILSDLCRLCPNLACVCVCACVRVCVCLFSTYFPYLHASGKFKHTYKFYFRVSHSVVCNFVESG
jgi:hypothetical protein